LIERINKALAETKIAGARRYLAESQSNAYKEVFPWMDQIHLVVISPAKIR
jgi:hypothetical protein